MRSKQRIQRDSETNNFGTHAHHIVTFIKYTL